MSGSENTRKRIDALDRSREASSDATRASCVKNEVCSGSNAASLDYVAADLDALAVRIEKLEQGNPVLGDAAVPHPRASNSSGNVGASSGGDVPASPAPPASDDEIVEAIARVVYRVEMDCEESAATADEEGVAVARAVLAALRARGSVVR